MSRGVECTGEEGGIGSPPSPTSALFSFNAAKSGRCLSKGRLKCRDPRQFVYRPAFSSTLFARVVFFTIFFFAFLPSSLPFLLSPLCTLYAPDPLLRSNKIEERFFLQAIFARSQTEDDNVILISSKYDRLKTLTSIYTDLHLELSDFSLFPFSVIKQCQFSSSFYMYIFYINI